jgi:hypothetical protein
MLSLIDDGTREGPSNRVSDWLHNNDPDAPEESTVPEEEIRMLS